MARNEAGRVHAPNGAPMEENTKRKKTSHARSCTLRICPASLCHSPEPNACPCRLCSRTPARSSTAPRTTQTGTGTVRQNKTEKGQRSLCVTSRAVPLEATSAFWALYGAGRNVLGWFEKQEATLCLNRDKGSLTFLVAGKAARFKSSTCNPTAPLPRRVANASRNSSLLSWVLLSQNVTRATDFDDGTHFFLLLSVFAFLDARFHFAVFASKNRNHAAKFLASPELKESDLFKLGISASSRAATSYCSGLCESSKGHVRLIAWPTFAGALIRN